MWTRARLQPFWVRDALKRRLGPTWQRRLRHTGRLRWITKARLLQRHGVSWRQKPWLAARFVLLDPEVESFTYELADREELLDFAARVTGHPRDAISGYAAETDVDQALLRFPRRWSHKRRLPLANRLLWYVAARALKPAVVVETGVHDGLGSLALLRALERNSEEGRPGRLISVDLHEDTGRLVPPRLRSRWTRVIGSSERALAPALDGLRVGLSIHDASPAPAVQAAEFDVVLRHRAERLLVVNCNGPVGPALGDACARAGGTEYTFTSHSRGHVHPGNLVAVGVFPDGGATGGRGD